MNTPGWVHRAGRHPFLDDRHHDIREVMKFLVGVRNLSVMETNLL